MKIKSLFLVALCLNAICATIEANTPERDYTMVDLHNRLTTKLIDVGTTSITISVEWPLDIEIESKWFDLLGKGNIEERGWDYLTFLEFDQTQGKAMFEILYDEMPWNDFEWLKVRYEKKVFLAVRIPIPTNLPWGPVRGKYEEDDEEDAIWGEGWSAINDEAPSVVATGMEAPNAEKDVAQVSPPPPSDRNETTDIVKPAVADTYNEPEPPEEKQNRLWLYLALPLGVLGAIAYFMRKNHREN